MEKSKEAIKVGLATLTSPEKNWPLEVLVETRKSAIAARNALQGMGFEVLDCGELTRGHRDAAVHGAKLVQMGAEVLVIYVDTWAYSSSAVSLVTSARIPCVVWTNAYPHTGGLIGATIVKGALDEVGIDASLVYGNFDDPEAMTELRKHCRARALVSRLRGLTYGMAGARSLGMYTAVIDPNEWKSKFGIEVDSYDQLEVVELARHMGDSDARRYLEWMRQEFGAVYVSDEVAIASIKLYLALKHMIAERGFDFLSVRCLPEMPEIYTTFCVAVALLNDSSDADGPKERYCCSCECDANGALTMQILKHFGEGPANFADVRYLDLNTGILSISNCGSQATELACCRKEVYWVPHGFKEFAWKIGGAAPQYVCKPGRVTLARLGRIDGEYIMLIFTGDALNEPRERLKTTFWEFSPHAFIRLDVPPRQLVSCLRSNHICMVYGDWQDELVEFCHVAGIRPILP